MRERGINSVDMNAQNMLSGDHLRCSIKVRFDDTSLPAIVGSYGDKDIPALVVNHAGPTTDATLSQTSPNVSYA